jgi:hypothetical protein
MVRDYYTLLGVHPYTDDRIVTLVYEFRCRRYRHPYWMGDREEAETRLAELREAHLTLTDPERSAWYINEFGHNENKSRKILIEYDLFDEMLTDIKDRLSAARLRREDKMNTEEKLEFHRALVAARATMKNNAVEEYALRQIRNRDELERGRLSSLRFWVRNDRKIQKFSHESTQKALSHYWEGLGLDRKLLTSSAEWVIRGSYGSGVDRYYELWITQIEGECVRQLINAITRNPLDFWEDAPQTFDLCQEFQTLNTLLYHASYSRARAEYEKEVE